MRLFRAASLACLLVCLYVITMLVAATTYWIGGDTALLILNALLFGYVLWEFSA